MKKIFYSLMFVLIVMFSGKAYGQDPDAATPSTPIEEGSVNLFANRTAEQEEALEEYQLELTGQERIYTIRIGQAAPVTGTLFNTEAVAWLDTRNQFLHRYYVTALNLRMNQLRASTRLHLETLELRLSTQEQANNIIIENLRSQVTTYEANSRISLGLPTPNTRRATRRRVIMVSIASSIAAATLGSYITYIQVKR